MIKKIIASAQERKETVNIKELRRLDRLIACEIGTSTGESTTAVVAGWFNNPNLHFRLNSHFIYQGILEQLPGDINKDHYEIIELGAGKEGLLVDFLNETEYPCGNNTEVTLTEPHLSYLTQLNKKYPGIRSCNMGIGDIKEAQDKGKLPQDAYVVAINFIDIFKPEALPRIALMLSEVVRTGKKVIFMNDRLSPYVYNYAQQKYGSSEHIIMPDPMGGNLIKVSKTFLKRALSVSEIKSLQSAESSKKDLEKIYKKCIELLTSGSLVGLRSAITETITLEEVFRGLLSESFSPYFNISVKELSIKVNGDRMPENKFPGNNAALSPVGALAIYNPGIPAGKIQVIAKELFIVLTRKNDTPKITGDRKAHGIERSAILECKGLFVSIKEWACINSVRLHEDDPIKDDQGNPIQVEIVGLTSEAGKKLNGKRATLESACIDDKGALRFIVDIEGQAQAKILGTALIPIRTHSQQEEMRKTQALLSRRK